MNFFYHSANFMPTNSAKKWHLIKIKMFVVRSICPSFKSSRDSNMQIEVTSRRSWFFAAPSVEERWYGGLCKILINKRPLFATNVFIFLFSLVSTNSLMYDNWESSRWKGFLLLRKDDSFNLLPTKYFLLGNIRERTRVNSSLIFKKAYLEDEASFSTFGIC